MQDRNFDDIAEKFSVTLQHHQRAASTGYSVAGSPIACWREWVQKLRVLDAGGGGQTAIKMAERGHQVILCDLSAQMIDRAKQAARNKGVRATTCEFIHCAAPGCSSHLETPLVMLFQLLGGWPIPAAYYRPAMVSLRPGGVLSLMFYNAHGLLMHNMVARDFDYVRDTKNGRFRQIIRDRQVLSVAGRSWLANYG